MLHQWTTLATLRAQIATWKQAGDTVALVPTMGALHDGHLSLVAEAKKHADRVVVSIFVNPTQFGPHEDFDRYPRPLENDLALLKQASVDGVWLPTVAEMYPAGFATTIHVSGLSEGLDGAARPGHFDGVAQVVTKLLLQVMPTVAIFGEKDYQQLAVIKRLVGDLNIHTEILGAPIARAEDGLALSSRNQYLSENEHAIAPTLYRVLQGAARQIAAGESVATVLASGKAQMREAGFGPIDYLALCDASSLQPLFTYQPPARLLIAAWLGKTRLIDNLEV